MSGRPVELSYFSKLILNDLKSFNEQRKHSRTNILSLALSLTGKVRKQVDLELELTNLDLINNLSD